MAVDSLNKGTAWTEVPRMGDQDELVVAEGFW